MTDEQREATDLEAAIAQALGTMNKGEEASPTVAIDGMSATAQAGTFHVELRRADVPPAVAEPAAADGPVASDDDARAYDPITVEDLDAEADAAADFLEGFLDAMDVPGDLKIRVHDDRAEVEIADVGNGALIGRRGQTLDALQELVRSSLQRQFQRRSHVQIDAEGYRARRLEKLFEKVDDAIDAVLESGDAVRLEPMDVYERKAVHQRVADVDGIISRSLGREPGRRVVIERDDAA